MPDQGRRKPSGRAFGPAPALDRKSESAAGDAQLISYGGMRHVADQMPGLLVLVVPPNGGGAVLTDDEAVLELVTGT